MQPIQMYRTTDGEMFETAADANLHEEKIQSARRVDIYLEEIFGADELPAGEELPRGKKMRRAMMRRIILDYLTSAPK